MTRKRWFHSHPQPIWFLNDLISSPPANNILEMAHRQLTCTRWYYNFQQYLWSMIELNEAAHAFHTVFINAREFLSSQGWKSFKSEWSQFPFFPSSAVSNLNHKLSNYYNFLYVTRTPCAVLWIKFQIRKKFLNFLIFLCFVFKSQ